MRPAFLLLAALALSACPRSTPPPGLGLRGPQPLGKISEAEFKALHELRTDAPPELNGMELNLDDRHAYLVRPDNVLSPPGIVLIHEWWGLNDHIKHWADRLAGLGYAVIAVDLYSPTRQDPVVATTPDEAMALMQAVDEAKADATIATAIEHLRTDEYVNTRSEKVAVMGWCFGGGWALEAALDHPDLDAVVMYYGMPETDPARLATLKPPLLGIFANQDSHITPEVVDQFEAALGEAGVKAELRRYDAEHAFANPSNPVYDEVNAAAAWDEVVAFLARTMQ